MAGKAEYEHLAVPGLRLLAKGLQGREIIQAREDAGGWAVTAVGGEESEGGGREGHAISAREGVSLGISPIILEGYGGHGGTQPPKACERSVPPPSLTLDS